MLMPCAWCGMEVECKWCSRCGDVAYCGKKCQTLNWSLHKLTCSDKVAIKDTGDRGKGVFAKLDFQVGDEIIRDAPCLSWTLDEQGDVNALELCTAFEQSSKAAQWVVSNLTNAYEEIERPEFEGILQTNSIGMGGKSMHDGSSTAGIFARICRVNHACNPNARFVWREDLDKELLLAMRPIFKGEEITVTYNGLCAKWQDRQNDLFARWRFDCSCVTCTDMYTPTQDNYLSELHELSQTFPNVVLFNPKKAFEMCKRVLYLKKLTKFDTPIDLGPLHYEAYQLAVACNQMKQAKRHMQAAYEYAKLHDGPNSPLVVQYAGLLRR